MVLLVAEGATLLHLGALLTVHAFVGMLLIPIVALKLASTGWKMLRYYLRDEEYVRRGPPHVFLRALVGPLTVVSTISLFATGVALLVLDRPDGPLVGLHKASFVVWLGATSVHVLTRVFRVAPAIRRRAPGLAVRLSLVAGSLAAGVLLATVTLPAADRLQDDLSAHVGLDAN